MKRVLIVIMFLAFGLLEQADALSIDVTGATTEIKASDTIKLSKVKVDGYTGTYWVELKWDATENKFVSITAGAEQATTTPSSNIAGGVWSNGTSISFYVSADGSKITSTGSSLSNNASIVYTKTMCGEVVALEIKGDITIKNKKFSGSAGNNTFSVDFSGTFDETNTTASVELWYVSNDGCISFSGTLQATHQ